MEKSTMKTLLPLQFLAVKKPAIKFMYKSINNSVKIVGQSESCMVCLSLVLSLMSTESLIEVLPSV